MEKRAKNKVKRRDEPDFVESSGNVFRDVGFADADELQVKADLTRQIALRLAEFGLTQQQAASRLGLKQPDVSRLANGRHTGFSTDRLISILTALEVDVEIIVRPRSMRPQNRGAVRVLAGTA